MRGGCDWSRKGASGCKVEGGDNANRIQFVNEEREIIVLHLLGIVDMWRCYVRLLFCGQEPQ
jgi:hypothetical protein